MAMLDIIALIPARAGSKGIPDKNMSKVNDKTLIEHAFIASCQSKKIDAQYISTDSKAYLQHAKDIGLENLGLRPKQLARDTTKTRDVISSFLDDCEKKIKNRPRCLVLLQPTSPLRDGELIDKCIDLCLRTNKVVTTLAEVVEPNPYKMYRRDGEDIKPLFEKDFSSTPRQRLPQVFQLTGAVYAYPITKSDGDQRFEPEEYVITKNFVNIDHPDDLILANEKLF